MERPLGFVVILTLTLATLTALAHARPPDQTWISGLYDNADYDDVIPLATWAASTPTDSPLLALELPPVFVDLVSRASTARVTNPDARLNALCVRMSETVSPPEISVEGETG